MDPLPALHPVGCISFRYYSVFDMPLDAILIISVVVLFVILFFSSLFCFQFMYHNLIYDFMVSVLVVFRDQLPSVTLPVAHISVAVGASR